MQLLMNINKYMQNFTDRAEEMSKLPLNQIPKKDEDRNKVVSDMIEEYYAATGKMPKSYMLSYLANYLLSGDLKDKDADKVTNTEYPVLSEFQIKRRESKQIPMEADVMNFIDSKQNKGLDSLAKTPIRKPAY